MEEQLSIDFNLPEWKVSTRDETGKIIAFNVPVDTWQQAYEAVLDGVDQRGAVVVLIK